jgi:hypothetical protein
MATKKKVLKAKVSPELGQKNWKKIYDGAYKLLVKGWCQKSFAKKANGSFTDVDNKRATQFCLDGAVDKASRNIFGKRERSIYFAAVNYAESCLPKKNNLYQCLWTFNDAPRRTQQQVLDFLDHVRNSL